MRFLALFCFLLLSACTGGGPHEAQRDYTIVSVFYGTDRAAATPEDASKYYTAQRSAVSYGRADISIPATHKTGDVERPEGMWGFEMKEDPKTHVIVAKLKHLGKDAFFKGVSDAAGGKQVLVFIHGYNFAFDTALRRTAQLSYDLEYPGPAVLFSWPSMGAVGGYPHDATNAQWAASDLETFLSDVAQKTGAAQVDIIAHSMGNQPLFEALRHLATTKSSVHFREIILAAPDIDADIFRRAAAEIQGTAQRVTLYTSSGDGALKASRKFNGYARAGDAGEGIVVVPGIDTIDASSVSTDIMGHSYYGNSKSVLSDIRTLLSSGTPPFTRAGMRQATRDGQSYWRLAP